jgi:hypothetical protein
MPATVAYDLRHLAAFTTPASSSLQRVCLTASKLTVQQLLPLACLPNLRWLNTLMEPPESFRARVHAEERLRDTVKGRSQPQQNAERGAWTEDWEASLPPPPLASHQREEMRQRVLRVYGHYGGLFTPVGQVDGAIIRNVFFGELSLLSLLPDQAEREAEG